VAAGGGAGPEARARGGGEGSNLSLETGRGGPARPFGPRAARYALQLADCAGLEMIE